MKRMRVGVVADDITGANDIGICFANGGCQSAVFPQELLQDRDLQAEARELDVVIIDTDSRFDDPGTAAAKVAEATRLLRKLPCDRYFNKTCSVFRGNIGAEFDSMQDVLGVASSMVILGFPKNGRTTVDGVHYVYGVRLEDSQFRSDPIHPMELSYLPDILAKQSDRSVGLVTWKDLDQGVLHVKAKKEELKKEGCAYVLFDIRSQEDLALVAEAVVEEENICGSSAIGEFLPEAYRRMQEEQAKEPQTAGGQALVVAGSLTEQSKAQTAHIRALGWPVFELDSQTVFDQKSQNEAEQQLIRQAVAAMRDMGSAMICSQQDAERAAQAKERGRQLGLSWEAVGKLISGSLSYAAEEILRQTGCRNLVVAGGDTSAAVTRQLGIYRMEIGREIEPGVPLMKGTSRLGPLNLVLKSGSFGSAAFLEKAVKETVKGE
ncbi:MAG: four-carbon acid sugar kinase family protein [Lachnospiraceae bacterium]|nr:four-carbon acid sugar kinase family protein [Lachnospiraceae bacterium]